MKNQTWFMCDLISVEQMNSWVHLVIICVFLLLYKINVIYVEQMLRVVSIVYIFPVAFPALQSLQLMS